MQAGKIVGLMTDLNTLSGGTVADFPGMPATCPSGPAAWQFSTACPSSPQSQSGPVKAAFAPTRNPIRPLQAATYSDAAMAQLTRRINAAFEPWILEYAEQYNWLHPRWRARPDGSRWTLQMTEADLARERTSPCLAVADRVRRLLAPG